VEDEPIAGHPLAWIRDQFPAVRQGLLQRQLLQVFEPKVHQQSADFHMRDSL
jgi:hypothetical protein